MKKTLILLLAFNFILGLKLNAQTEIEQINTTLQNYIEGTANGEPERLKSAFLWAGAAIDPNTSYYLSSECSFVSVTNSVIAHTGIFSGQLILDLAEKRRANINTNSVAESQTVEYGTGARRLMRYLINNALGGVELHSRKLMKGLSTNSS